MTAETSLTNFSELKSTLQSFIEQDLSESDTRSKTIDAFFKGVLGWSEQFITREGHSDSGYYDYKFSIPGFSFVVEAKRGAVEFVLPANHTKTTASVLEKGNKDIILQLRKYLVDSSLTHGVLTNGNQFVIGKFINSNGTDWRKNKCIIFNGIDDISSRFIEFFNLLSYDCICANGVIDVPCETKINGRRLISSVVDSDAELVRNTLSSSLSGIIEKYFGELAFETDSGNDELAIECFVENKEIKKNLNEIERHFADLPPKLEKVIQARNTASIKS